MATTINLSWPANPASEGVIDYRVYQSLNSGSFALVGTVTSPSHSILNPPAGSLRYKVIARNFVGDSVESDIVNGPEVPSKPGSITLTVVNS